MAIKILYTASFSIAAINPIEWLPTDAHASYQRVIVWEDSFVNVRIGWSRLGAYTKARRLIKANGMVLDRLDSGFTTQISCPSDGKYWCNRGASDSIIYPCNELTLATRRARYLYVAERQEVSIDPSNCYY